MKFRMRVAEEGHEDKSWWEGYDRPGDSEDNALALLYFFNGTRRPNEPLRVLLEVDVEGPSEAHNWRKSNLVTIMKGGMHDAYQCTKCGITAKRYGLQNGLVRDPKFKAPKYAKCKSAL